MSKDLSDRLVILPHIGSASVPTRTKMSMIAVENLLAGSYSDSNMVLLIQL
jgi:lactate dehydrogenase-like 2-hydroxyacid dehydrogenase